MSSSNTAHGHTPQTSGFAEAANQAASVTAVFVALVISGSVYLVARRWWGGVGEAFRVVPIFYVLVVLGAVLCVALLAGRGRLIGDHRAIWVATGIGLAGIAALGQLTAIMRLPNAPLQVGVDGLAALYLLWHAALVVFSLGAIVTPRWKPLRWALGAVFSLAIVAACMDTTSAILPDLVGERDNLTPLYRSLQTTLIVATGTTLFVWVIGCGRRPTRPDVWIAVGLGLAALDLIVASGSGQLFESIWWSSAALRAAQFAVPATGLLADGLRLMHLLRLHEQSLLERLHQERELAVRLTEKDPGNEDDEQRIRSILEQRAFRTVFQPVYSLRTGRLIAVEALTRFTAAPQRTPDHWFAEASRCGLGVDLELAALEAALQAADQLPEGVALTVNLSPSTVTDVRLRDHLAILGTPAPRLVIEITEHAAVDDYPLLLEALRALRHEGVLVAIDDAGAGFASLRHIVHLEPDIIKLDMSLTRDVHRDPVRRTLAASLIDFAEQMGIELIAEGVETQAELEALAAIGAHAAQGYLLGRPGDLPVAPSAALAFSTPHRTSADLEILLDNPREVANGL